MAFAGHVRALGSNVDVLLDALDTQFAELVRQHLVVLSAAGPHILENVRDLKNGRRNQLPRLAGWDKLFHGNDGCNVLVTPFVQAEVARRCKGLNYPDYVEVSKEPPVFPIVAKVGYAVFSELSSVSLQDAMVFSSALAAGADVLLTGDGGFLEDGTGGAARSTGGWPRKHAFSCPEAISAGIARPLLVYDHRAKQAPQGLEPIFKDLMETRSGEILGTIESRREAPRRKGSLHDRQLSIVINLEIQEERLCRKEFDCSSDVLEIYNSRGKYGPVKLTHFEFGYGETQWRRLGEEEIREAIGLWERKYHDEWRGIVEAGSNRKPWYVGPRRGKSGYLLVSAGIDGNHGNIDSDELYGTALVLSRPEHGA